MGEYLMAPCLGLLVTFVQYVALKSQQEGSKQAMPQMHAVLSLFSCLWKGFLSSGLVGLIAWHLLEPPHPNNQR